MHVARAIGAVATALVVLAACATSPGVAPLNSHLRTAVPRWPMPDANRAAYTIDQGGPIITPETDTLNGYTTRAFTDAQGDTMTYYLFTPPQASREPGVRLPLTLVLIGAGERAVSGETAAQNAAKALNDPYVKLWSSSTVQANWPGYVLVPQVVNPNRWVNVPGSTGSYHLAPQPSTWLTMAKAILDLTIRESSGRIDTRRVYVTGISMGGYGVWDAIERWPATFAAAAPISGAGDPSGASEIAHMPLWVFHGSHDTTVPISGSENMVAALKTLGGDPRFTIIPSVGHDIWMKAYSYPGFLAWLYAQRASG